MSRSWSWGLRSTSVALLLVGATSSACGGLIDTDSETVPTTDSDGEVPGAGGSVQTACTPAQWDCAREGISCDYVEDAFGSRLPIISVSGPCSCDASRPARPSDCAEGELFVCGSLSFSDGFSTEVDQLSFEPVSCRCAINAGYYCSHCIKTGLYASEADAAGCGLDSTSDDSSGIYCGCGE